MENKEAKQTEQVKFGGWYDRCYKWILILPAIMIIFSLVYLYNFEKENGDIILKDVSLTGGTTITVFDKSVDIKKLENDLKKDFPDLSIRRLSDIRTGVQIGFLFETKEEAEKTKKALENYLTYNLTSDNSSIEFSGANLSAGFYQQLRFAILLAFCFMAIVVFIIFRTFVPSFAVILSAFADIMMTVVVVDMLGISVSSAGVIAFLMLIGYSVDTDILLTTRMLKKKEEEINQRLWGAFKTGMTMTLTSIAAVGIALIIIYNLSETLRQIFMIILIGLGFDIFNTWITNASILKWYVERKDFGGKK
ncbi:MAG: protein translocase subunit SecF [Candidatus Pacearchaeota archaeon]|nr:protein translocase subunit SecF [Candidatus Pacearchaeota archaeon]